jgi:heterodisulfide reductase subunit C
MATVQGLRGAELLEQLGACGDGKSPQGCMQCGLCAASCPLGPAMEFPPRNLILQASAGNLDRVLASPSLWMCVACHTCSKRCPRGIELADALWPALRDAAMQQGFQPPAELQETFQNIFKYGNTLGRSPRTRLEWAKDLDVRVLDLSKESRPVES